MPVIIIATHIIQWIIANVISVSASNNGEVFVLVQTWAQELFIFVKYFD
jgi:hypothetical protein